MWISLTKPMQKSMTTIGLHCGFARLKNKHKSTWYILTAKFGSFLDHRETGEKGLDKK